MLKKTMTYTDYDGNERTEDFYFNLTKAEVVELQLGPIGGLSKMLEKLVQEQDTGRVIELFKTIVMKAYGEKSADGRRFVKNQELRDAFAQTEAYSDLFIELVSDAKYAAEFIDGILPQGISEKKPEITVV